MQLEITKDTEGIPEKRSTNTISWTKATIRFSGTTILPTTQMFQHFPNTNTCPARCTKAKNRIWRMF